MPSNAVPPFPGVTPATICVPYSLHALVWNCPVAPVMPWVRTRVCLLTRMDISKTEGVMPLPLTLYSLRLHCLYDLLRRFGHRLCGNNRQAGFGEDLSALLHVGSLHAHDQRNTDVQLARGIHNALSQYVATHDAAENINQHAAHPRVGQENFESLGDL